MTGGIEGTIWSNGCRGDAEVRYSQGLGGWSILKRSGCVIGVNVVGMKRGWKIVDLGLKELGEGSCIGMKRN